MEIIKITCGKIENNNYILKKDNKCLIVDLSDFKAIDTYISENNLEVLGILLTHTHWDHLLGVQEFVEKHNTPVYLSSTRPNYISDAGFDYTLQKYNLKTNFDLDKIDVTYLDQGSYNIHEFKFDVINTSGHTYCSIVYHFVEDKSMFTGDFLFRETIGITNTQLSDRALMKESLKKIKEYPSDISIYPGHGGDSTLKHEKNYNNFLLKI